MGSDGLEPKIPVLAKTSSSSSDQPKFSNQQTYHLLKSGFLLDLIFNLENGGDVLL
jgi:hypothetical protein